MHTTHSVALLFSANKIYDREIITGIASYLSRTRVTWNLFMEEDFRYRLNGMDAWKGDGIIADFDDPAVCKALANSKLPVVAVGGSYQDPSHYPPGIPYVATDNFQLVSKAYEHLVEAGLSKFALYSLPEMPVNRWAQERELAFEQLMQRDRLEVQIYRGQTTSASTWNETVEQLSEWLHTLPKPVGIIAVTDSRARQLLQTCAMTGIAVPEQVALIGIDNDPLTQLLTRIPLSSVIHAAQEMGRTAAQMLHELLNGKRIGAVRVLVPPLGVNGLTSSQHEATKNPYVMRARHFIRQFACQGIKAEQVADYVGISRSSLESHFRQHMGKSVHEEILLFKLEAATKLLVTQKCSAVQVATHCGFTSVQYLHAVFKRELGCTPRQFQVRSNLQRQSSA